MILVTGGSGFQGQALCKRLTELGKKVLSVSIEVKEADGYISLHGDITDKATMSVLFNKYPIDTVVHLASLLHTESYNNPNRAFQVNVLGSVNLLDLCLEMDIKRFVFGSTVDAIGYQSLSADPVDESIEILPTDFYGETKRFIEKMGLAFHQKYGLQFISARIPFLVGPGQPTGTSTWRMDMFNLLKRGGLIDFGFEPDVMIPMSHIEDSANALAKLVLAAKPAHSIYHIPCESLRVVDLAREIERIGTGVKVVFGSKKADFYPQYINTDRFNEEFNFTPVSIYKRLEGYLQA